MDWLGRGETLSEAVAGEAFADIAPHVLSDPEVADQPKHDAGRAYRSVIGGLAISDALAIILALAIGHFVSPGSAVVQSLSNGLLLIIATVGWAGIFASFGLYNPRHLSAIEEFRRVVGATSVGIMVVVMLGFWSETELPRSLVARVWILALLFELVNRRLWRLEVARRRASGVLALRTLIIGTNEEAKELYGQLSSHGSGFSPLGYIGAGSSEVADPGLFFEEGIAGLDRTIEDLDVECVFVASSALRPDEMFQVMSTARQMNVDVRISANLPEILASRVAIQPIGNSLSLSVRPLQLSRTQAVAKRLSGLAIAASLALVTAPLWAMIALAIKITSSGPVFFKQTRVTRGGRPFTMIKFRTMVEGESLDADTTSPFFKIVDDPRITKVGKFLRRTSLDELPQLLNVIKGDMSLVGPRPLPQEQVDANPDLLAGRLQVPAGMTGWWQIRGRSEVPADVAVRLDLFYVENWSLSLDIYILLKTIGVVFRRVGAF